MTGPPPPSALRALWTRRRWFEAFGHKGQGLGHVARTAQMLQWCWGRRDAGSSLEPSPTHYEGLDGHQSLKERLNIKTPQRQHTVCILNRPVMLIFRAKATFASPTALSRAL